MALSTWAMACASGVTRGESDKPAQRRTGRLLSGIGAGGSPDEPLAADASRR